MVNKQKIGLHCYGPFHRVVGGREKIAKAEGVVSPCLRSSLPHDKTTITDYKTLNIVCCAIQ